MHQELKRAEFLSLSGEAFPSGLSNNNGAAHQNYSIEPLNPVDLDAFRAFMLKIIGESPYKASEFITLDLWERENPAYYKDAQQDPERWLLLAAKNSQGEIIGGLEAEIGPKKGLEWESVGHIIWSGVKQEERNRGIGLELCRSCETILRRRGIPAISGSIHKDNHASQHVATKAGRTARTIPGWDHIVYFKAL